MASENIWSMKEFRTLPLFITGNYKKKRGWWYNISFVLLLLSRNSVGFCARNRNYNWEVDEMKLAEPCGTLTIYSCF